MSAALEVDLAALVDVEGVDRGALVVRLNHAAGEIKRLRELRILQTQVIDAQARKLLRGAVVTADRLTEWRRALSAASFHGYPTRDVDDVRHAIERAEDDAYRSEETRP